MFMPHTKYPLKTGVLCLMLVLFAASCQTVKPLHLQQIKNVGVRVAQPPVLQAEAVIHNPNRVRVKLRRAIIEVHVDGKPAASIQQDFNFKIPPQSDFTLPLEVTVNLNDTGLLNTVLSLLNARKFEVAYTGTLWLSYRGIRMKLPVNHREEVRLRF